MSNFYCLPGKAGGSPGYARLFREFVPTNARREADNGSTTTYYKLKLNLSSVFCTDATRTDRDAGARQSYPRAPENPEGCSYSGYRLFPSHVHDLLAASALRSG